MSWFRKKPRNAVPDPKDGTDRGNKGSGRSRKNGSADSCISLPRELPRGIDADFCYSEEQKG